MFTNIYAWKDNYPLVYDDTMPPVFDNYCDDNYAIENNYNHPYGTCHNYEGNHFPTKNHPSNIQLVYHLMMTKRS